MKAWWNVPSAISSIQPPNIEIYSSMLNTVLSNNIIILCFCVKRFSAVFSVSLWTFWITYFTSDQKVPIYFSDSGIGVNRCIIFFFFAWFAFPWQWYLPAMVHLEALVTECAEYWMLRWLTFCTVKVLAGEKIVQVIACASNLLHQQATILCFVDF